MKRTPIKLPAAFADEEAREAAAKRRAHPTARARVVLALRIEPHASQTMSVGGIGLWRKRVECWLRVRGLTGVIAPWRMCVLAQGRELKAAECERLIGWLLEQPEVRRVTIEQPRGSRRRVGFGRGTGTSQGSRIKGRRRTRRCCRTPKQRG